VHIPEYINSARLQHYHTHAHASPAGSLEEKHITELLDMIICDPIKHACEALIDQVILIEFNTLETHYFIERFHYQLA
jgi:hypothetical protein